MEHVTGKTLESLDERFRPRLADKQVSADGARKYAFSLHDGHLVEAVGIPHGDAHAPDRLTVCFSTQAGCAMGCAFCATGKQGLRRNLAADEMVWQIELVGRDFGCRVDSAIAMGQGEPLANFAELSCAIGVIGDPEGMDIRADELVLSTCGIPDGIRAMASEGTPATLAVSLHSGRQSVRDELMPGVRNFPLDWLHAELARYSEVTGRSVVVQYLMLEHVNDGEADFEALVEFSSDLDARVCLLQYNAVEGVPFAPSAFGKTVLWSHELNRRGIDASVNKPRGADIAAACGQLANRIRA